MTGVELEALFNLIKTVVAIPAVGWVLKLLVTHYFKLRSDNKQLENDIDKQRIVRQDDANERTKEVASDLRERQKELSDSYSQVSEILNSLRSEISSVRQSFSDLRLDVEKSNAKYDLLTSKFMDYIPIANKRIETLESAFGKIIQK